MVKVGGELQNDMEHKHSHSKVSQRDPVNLMRDQPGNCAHLSSLQHRQD